jgi:hypothetical protein
MNMKTLQITDPELLAQLRTTGKVDVTDASGLVVGRVEFQAAIESDFGLTDAEIDRLIADPKTEWIPADVVLAHLKQQIQVGA